MMNYLISIVIPAYHAARFIQNTVDSIVAQTYNNWELIIVDDGSKDDTGAVIDRIAQNNEKVRTFHQTNGGEVAARRTGVLHATGDWIMFVDADDSLPIDAVESLLKCANDQVDIVVGTMHVQNMSDDGNIVEDYVWQNSMTGKMSGEKFACGVFEIKVQMSAWAKLYRRKLFDGFEWCLDRTIKQNPDLLMNIGLGAKVQNVVVSNEVCYDYVIRSGSASTSGMMPWQGWFRLFDQAEKYISAYASPAHLHDSFVHYRLGCFDAMMRHGVINYSSSDVHVQRLLADAKSCQLNDDERKVVRLLRSRLLRNVFNVWQKLKK